MQFWCPSDELYGDKWQNVSCVHMAYFLEPFFVWIRFVPLIHSSLESNWVCYTQYIILYVTELTEYSLKNVPCRPACAIRHEAWMMADNSPMCSLKLESVVDFAVLTADCFDNCKMKTSNSTISSNFSEHIIAEWHSHSSTNIVRNEHEREDGVWYG